MAEESIQELVDRTAREIAEQKAEAAETDKAEAEEQAKAKEADDAARRQAELDGLHTAPTVDADVAAQVAQLEADGKYGEAMKLKVEHGTHGQQVAAFRDQPAADTGPSPEQLAADIKAAEEAGDWGKAMRLKSQRAGILV